MPKLVPQLKIINRLHVLRAEKRITQEHLAREIGITRSTIVAIEGGGYNPSLELAFRIARYFNKDINEVFSIEEET